MKQFNIYDEIIITIDKYYYKNKNNNNSFYLFLQKLNPGVDENNGENKDENKDEYKGENKDEYKGENKDENKDENKSENKSENKDENKDKNKKIFNSYLKKFYKKLILKTHPDKNKKNSHYFVDIQYFYEKKIIIGLIYYYIKLKLPKPEMNNDLSQIYLNEIYNINHYIVNL